LRKAFTLIELLVIIGIMGLMVTVGIVNVRSGQGAARTRGAARDIFAVIRHARSTALVTVQPAVITYSCVMEDEEPVAKIEIHSAKILGGNIDTEKLQTLSGEPVKTAEQDAKAETPAPENKDEEQIQNCIEDSADHKEIEGTLGIAHSPQDTGADVVKHQSQKTGEIDAEVSGGLADDSSRHIDELQH
jgi:type II secretory pathway pseudopilin PulG